MSNRYVWSKNSVISNKTKEENGTIGSGGSTGSFIEIDTADQFWDWEEAGRVHGLTVYEITRGPVYVKWGTSFTFANGKFVISNATSLTFPTGTAEEEFYSEYANGISFDFYVASDNFIVDKPLPLVYIGFSNSNANAFDALYCINLTTDEYVQVPVGFGAFPAGLDSRIIYYGNLASHGEPYTASRYAVGKGSAVGTVSNASSGAYPADGVSGSYWYDLQGSDTIDAASVTYSTQEPRGGQPITITVSPSTGNVYGGTVRYTYQVQLAGGAWTTIATNSTATSQQYTIPAGTASFAARVLASDTWGFSSTTYTTGATLTVINNEPPTAPGSITIGDVLGGEDCTITWTAATDPDGTVASYQLERQIDNGDTWTQIYSGPNLTYTDTINSEWATVNYRVRATDDDGEAGPYTTGTMHTVNAGWLYFSGPDADMGDKPAPFSFAFSIGSTTEGTTDINVSVLLDDENIYTGTPDAGEQVSVEIDTRLSYEGEHTIVVSFEAANLLGGEYVGTYNVPALDIPDGGHAVQLYNSDGQPVFPNTLARQVFGKGGNSAAKLFDRVYSGTYTGTGTSGQSNPLTFRLSFRPKIVAIQAAGASSAAFGLWVQSAEPTAQAQGSMVVYNGSTQSLATVQWDDTNMILSIYAASAAQQLNVSGQLYGIFVGGAMA